ncbi:hypothetical protein BsWGS_09451 [Bradybaena similaris]
MIHIVVLIIALSVVGAQAQDLGQCVDNLMNSAKAGGNLCPAAEEYIRCALVAMNLQFLNVSETDLINLENTLKTTLTSNGIYCNIDMRAILRKVNEDQSNAATRTTKKPTGYNDATTIGDCLNTFTGAITQADSPNCSLVTPYLKCLIRVTGLYKFDPYSPTYSETYSSLNSQLQTTFRSSGLFCNFDIKGLSAEVASEQNYRNSVSSTPISSWTAGYDGATTIEDCRNRFSGASTQAGSPNCSMLTPYLKCLIRVTGHKTSSNAYSFLETEIETISRSIGLNCNFDIKELTAEVAREQTYRNSESGLHTSVRGMMCLYTVTVAVWICSYFFLY